MRRAVDELHRHVDADVAKLPLQHLGDALADRKAGLGDQRELQRLAVLVADAIAVGVAPAGRVQQASLARATSNG